MIDMREIWQLLGFVLALVIGSAIFLLLMWAMVANMGPAEPGDPCSDPGETMTDEHGDTLICVES
jgi:hypothetical protein